MERNFGSSSGDQLRRPLISADGSQDVMVVVQCEPNSQLSTLTPPSAAARDQVKAFAKDAAQKTSQKQGLALVTALKSDSDGVEVHTLRQWRNQTALMWVWLLSSLVVVMFVPLFVSPGALLLASLTASALGVITALMHSMGDRLAETGTFGVADQIDLAAACATAAGCVDLLAMAMAVAWVWATANMSNTGLSAPEIMPLLMFACNCWQHGVASVAVMQTVGSLQE